MKNLPIKKQPFSNGTECEMWYCDNCYKCKKYDDDVNKTCKLEYDLGYCRMTDGLLSVETIEIINPGGVCEKFTNQK